jgi:hypothetical protein
MDNKQLAARLKDDADFLEGITPGGLESTEIIARVRLAAQRLEATEITEAKVKAGGEVLYCKEAISYERSISLARAVLEAARGA